MSRPQKSCHLGKVFKNDPYRYRYYSPNYKFNKGKSVMAENLESAGPSRQQSPIGNPASDYSVSAVQDQPQPDLYYKQEKDVQMKSDPPIKMDTNSSATNSALEPTFGNSEMEKNNEPPP